VGHDLGNLWSSLTCCRFDDDFKMIKRKGTIVSFGNASGLVEPVDLRRLTEKNVKLLRPTWVPRVFQTLRHLTLACHSEPGLATTWSHWRNAIVTARSSGN
jgi:hypothetical protein